MIVVENLTKYFDSSKVLDGITLQIKDGDFFCIIGSSGQGKSVFLQHLIGLLKPDSGYVAINGINITELSEKKLLKVRREFGYLFQESALFDYMNVYDNLALRIREHTKVSEKHIRQLIQEALREVELDESDVSDKFPVQLSGGMKKRAALARAIILKPKILFCDEPTSGLDSSTGLTIAKLIAKICKELSTTTVVVSHDVRNFFPLADMIAVINEGKIIAVGNRKEMEHSKNPVIKKLLLKD